jgi:hypothetical protein
MKPLENPMGSGLYYPTEKDYVENGCSEARMNGYWNDGRYINLGMTANQFDVQSHSGVLTML